MPKTNLWFSLTIPSQTRFMVLVREVIGQFSRQLGFADGEIHEIIVAVDEACTNVIRHCYQGCAKKRLLLECRSLDTGLEIRLKDFGPKVDLAKIKSPESIGEKPGGLGLLLIRSAMDEVEFYNDAPIGLELRMFKRYAHS